MNRVDPDGPRLTQMEPDGSRQTRINHKYTKLKKKTIFRCHRSRMRYFFAGVKRCFFYYGLIFWWIRLGQFSSLKLFGLKSTLYSIVHYGILLISNMKVPKYCISGWNFKSSSWLQARLFKKKKIIKESDEIIKMHINRIICNT